MARKFLTGDGIDWGNSISLFVSGDLSFGAWIKIDASGVSSPGTIAQRGVNGTTLDTVHSFALRVTGSPAPYSVGYFHDYGNGSFGEQEGNLFATNLSAATWYYVGISRDNTAKTVSLYTGIQGATPVTLIQVAGYTNQVNSAGGTSASCKFTVGYQAPTSNRLNNVAIGQFVYFSRALTELEHSLVKACAPPVNNLLLWAKLLGVSPETDLSSSGFTGTVTGTTVEANPACLGGGPAVPPGGASATMYIMH